MSRFLISWMEKGRAGLQKRLVEWDRRRIEEDEKAKVTREKIRAILLDRPAKTTWTVQRSLPD